MSRTLISASAAAILMALTGAADSAGAQRIFEGPIKEVATRLWPAAKTVGHVAGGVLEGLAEHDLKEEYKKRLRSKSTAE